VALVNRGRAAEGESTLNSTSPTDTRQALYMLPQSDYNVISSGTNVYSAGAGYNVVIGLGTPVADRLVPDLIAYQGPWATYAGPTVGPLQNTKLVSTRAASSGPIDVFSVFDSLIVGTSGHARSAPDRANCDVVSPAGRPAATGIHHAARATLEIGDPTGLAVTETSRPVAMGILPAAGVSGATVDASRSSLLETGPVMGAPGDRRTSPREQVRESALRVQSAAIGTVRREPATSLFVSSDAEWAPIDVRALDHILGDKAEAWWTGSARRPVQTDA
jgi:hypothetical protein